ncbi:hypothetical protein CLOP_g11821 [Closterium sp. NIES-67]|nr:hypothetical protein CLOP_g11821 [Closterium sp. NIES-67]
MVLIARLHSSFDSFLHNVPVFAAELASGLTVYTRQVEVWAVSYDPDPTALIITTYLLPVVQGGSAAKGEQAARASSVQGGSIQGESAAKGGQAARASSVQEEAARGKEAGQGGEAAARVLVATQGGRQELQQSPVQLSRSEVGRIRRLLLEGRVQLDPSLFGEFTVLMILDPGQPFPSPPPPPFPDPSLSPNITSDSTNAGDLSSPSPSPSSSPPSPPSSLSLLLIILAIGVPVGVFALVTLAAIGWNRLVTRKAQRNAFKGVKAYGPFWGGRSEGEGVRRGSEGGVEEEEDSWLAEESSAAAAAAALAAAAAHGKRKNSYSPPSSSSPSSSPSQRPLAIPERQEWERERDTRAWDRDPADYNKADYMRGVYLRGAGEEGGGGRRRGMKGKQRPLKPEFSGIPFATSLKLENFSDGAYSFSVVQVRAATENFSSGNLIGQGGFSRVYKGVLENGTPVAVKLLLSSRTSFRASAAGLAALAGSPDLNEQGSGAAFVMAAVAEATAARIAATATGAGPGSGAGAGTPGLGGAGLRTGSEAGWGAGSEAGSEDIPPIRDLEFDREFSAEANILSCLNHRNIAKLLGICREGNFRCLVFEFVERGTLHALLHGGGGMRPPPSGTLDWPTRLRIAVGIAQGVCYLHEDASPLIIHRDLKTANVLVDRDFTPKIADFGLARTVEAPRYMAPEYTLTGQSGIKSDVYSFGVILLELITGREAVDRTKPAGLESLVKWARPLLAEPRAQVRQLADPALEGRFGKEGLVRMAVVAGMCVAVDNGRRPAMSQVVEQLRQIQSEDPTSAHRGGYWNPGRQYGRNCPFATGARG